MDTNIARNMIAVIDVGINVAMIEARDVDSECLESSEICVHGLVLAYISPKA